MRKVKYGLSVRERTRLKTQGLTTRDVIMINRRVAESQQNPPGFFDDMNERDIRKVVKESRRWRF